MLTIFTVPKPFRGHIGAIQRNAIESWRALGGGVQIILVGDEEGVEDAARDGGVEHVGGLALNDRGTPRLDSAFDCAASVARWPLWCLVNADIVLLDDFPRAVERVAAAFDDFLIVGESRDLDVGAEARVHDVAARSQLHKRALESGRLRGYAALDYFVFPKGLFDPIPPFLIGRACFDNWLVWRARDRRHPVVDVTRSIAVVHQSHDYSHVAGGLDEAYYGEEARYNERLAGGRDHIYSLHEATHRLYRHGPPVPYWGSLFRFREKARLARVKIDIHLAARRARKNQLAKADPPVRLLGILPEPSNETTRLLDAIAAADDVDLSVVYARKPTDSDAWAVGSRHAHWFARSIQLARVDRAVGREYPITPTIWHSFVFLRPECMLIGGWSTFPTQAAIAWCIARRMPYLLLIDENTGTVPTNENGGLRRVLVGAVARRSAAVLVSNPDRRTALLAKGVRAEQVRDLRDVAATATRVADVVRTAGRTRTTPVPRLTHRLTRRARRRRSRSASQSR